VFWYFQMWSRHGVVRQLRDRLRDAMRDGDGRDPMASAGIVDAQSVNSAGTVGAATRGYDEDRQLDTIDTKTFAARHESIWVPVAEMNSTLS
jgi:hypothetical protein